MEEEQQQAAAAVDAAATAVVLPRALSFQNNSEKQNQGEKADRRRTHKWREKCAGM